MVSGILCHRRAASRWRTGQGRLRTARALQRRFTLQTYTPVIAGMDRDAADLMGRLITGGTDRTVNPDVSNSVSNRAIGAPQRD